MRGRVHGDLSEYNILIDADGPVIIDLPQAVDAAGNSHAKEMLLRDVRNLATSLGRFAPELLASEYGAEIWAHFEHGTLGPETELTGRFEHDTAPVKLGEVIQVIDDVKFEEAARRLRMGQGG